MSRSKKVFIAGAFLILVLIVVSGCLPNKQGGFTCVAAPLLDKIKSQLSTVQKSPRQIQHKHRPLPSLTRRHRRI